MNINMQQENKSKEQNLSQKNKRRKNKGKEEIWLSMDKFPHNLASIFKYHKTLSFCRCNEIQLSQEIQNYMKDLGYCYMSNPIA